MKIGRRAVLVRLGAAAALGLSAALVLAGCGGPGATKPKAASFFPRDTEVETKGARKARKVIVFVHGIIGGSRATWTSGGVSWFDLIRDDHDFDGFDLYSIGYDSPAIGTSSDIEEIATRVMQIEISDTLVRKYDEIHFIVHSMGGLVIKRALFKLKNLPGAKADGLRKVGAVLFISTPAAGSKLADWTAWLSGNPQLRNMQTDEAATYLHGIGADWRQLLAARPGTRLFPRSYCAYETKSVGPFHVVPRMYSEAMCDEEPVAFDESHVSIVPPKSRGDDSYRWTKARILDLTGRLEARDPAALLRAIQANMRPDYYRAALKPAQDWIDLEPDNAAPWRWKAEAYFKLHEYQSTLDAADKALKLKPDYYEVKFIAGSALMRQKQFQRAKPLWGQLLNEKVDWSDVQLNYAETLLALGEYEEAGRYFRSHLATVTSSKGRRANLLGLGIIEFLRKGSSAATRREGVARFREALCIDQNLQGVLFGRPVEEEGEWFDVYADLLGTIRVRKFPEFEGFIRDVSSGKGSC